MKKGKHPKNNKNKKVEDLTQFQENSDAQSLTTNHGLRINDDQNTLKAGTAGQR